MGPAVPRAPAHIDSLSDSPSDYPKLAPTRPFSGERARATHARQLPRPLLRRERTHERTQAGYNVCDHHTTRRILILRFDESFSTLNSAFEKQIVEEDERETTTQPTTTTRRILRVDESFSTLFCERARTRCPPRETAQLSRTDHPSDRVQQAHTYTHTKHIQSFYSRSLPMLATRPHRHSSRPHSCLQIAQQKHFL